MKKLLLLIVLIISLKSFSQTPSNFVYRNIYEHTKGSYPDSVLHLPVGCGAPALLTTRSWKGGAALYGDTCNNKLYFYRDTAWTLIGDSSYNDIRYLANTISCGLTCSACGIVTYTGTGMNYYVSPAYYNIDFVPYYFAGDSVTLADGDATFDRFDAIVLTATGVDTIQGVPTSDPQLPQFDPCANILLTYVLVTAGTTTPAQVSDEVIYDENVETWTHTTGGTITANFAGTAQVFHGTKSITISSWSNNSYINFLGPSSYINSNYSTLSFWVRLTAIMVNNQNVSVQFFNNTTAVSNPVVGQITKGNITTYQSVGFNMSQFTFTSPVFNTVRIQFSGSQSNTFYIDWVRLQAGIVQPPAPTGLNNAYTRVTDGTTTAVSVGGDIFKLRANAPLHATVTNNDATHGDNALFFADTLRSIANSLATNGIVKKQIDSLALIPSVNIYNSNGTLTSNRTVTGGGFFVTFDGSSSISVLQASNSSSGNAIAVSANSGNGVNSTSTSGFAGSFVSSSSSGIYAESASGIPAYFYSGPSSTNTVIPILQLDRRTSGTPANGIGLSIDFRAHTTGGSTELANQITSEWADVTNGTRTSTMKLKGVLSTTTVDLLTLAGDGSIMLRGITATAASAITPANGMIVYVTSTDATFTSVGFWGYQNGAWGKF